MFAVLQQVAICWHVNRTELVVGTLIVTDMVMVSIALTCNVSVVLMKLTAASCSSLF